MDTNINTGTNIDPLNTHTVKETICVKSIFSGTIVALLAYSALLAMGLAFGGTHLENAIQGPDTFKGLGIGTIAWIVVSVTAALFVGSYVAKISRHFVSERVGRIQGVVISGIFFLIMLAQIGSGIAAVGRAAGGTAGAAAEAGKVAVQNPRVQSTIEDSLGTSTLKSSPEVFAQGLAMRILRGDTESATNYYAYQAGISQEEAKSRIATLTQKTNEAVTEAGMAAGKTMKFAGWFLFALILTGTLAGFLGGSLNLPEEGSAERIHPITHSNPIHA